MPQTVPQGVVGRRLSSPPSDLWDVYLEAERRGLRGERNDALNRFLAAFAELHQTEQHDWALGLASNIVDDNASTPIRLPLFRSVLLPALETAIAQRTPGAARWLAGFVQQIYKCRELRPRLMDGTLTEHALLLTALDHDPGDDRSRRKLLGLLASRLNNTLHELPTGVLYGNDGASFDQCREMLQELDGFIRYANRLGIAEEYADLVANCQFHYKAYAEYLTDRREASCYADYLSRGRDL
ncbi:hypothetical protein [Fuerstiella marisgermanici]|uniref:hypothetical protein n=1 Tax=Fuerstiella marisgermanici TaxID=1891926 RepID=UPI0011AB43DC|nr:hypothetical protein [Fuerstiella marisgermanici]